eukprot:jgi/Mesvir1/27826/Mv07504-RA.1
MRGRVLCHVGVAARRDCDDRQQKQLSQSEISFVLSNVRRVAARACADAVVNPDKAPKKHDPAPSAGELRPDHAPLPARLGPRPRVVVLGSGWAAVSFITHLSKAARKMFEIIMVSPQNFFLFTPLLPSAAVGTVDARSLGDPMHAICRARGIEFLQAVAENVRPQAQRGAVEAGTVLCRSLDGRPFQLDYDYAVLAVGAVNNTFGTPGVDKFCHFLKTGADARGIRARIIQLFENANVPGVGEDERRRMLHFVVVGGGRRG